jgi:anthranilate synthase component I
VGYFGFSRVSLDGQRVEDEGAMDTCIALRTMVVIDGIAYLQAGGGIVFDSVEEDEWEETMNKLRANINCISSAEEKYSAMENGVDGKAGKENGTANGVAR